MRRGSSSRPAPYDTAPLRKIVEDLRELVPGHAPAPPVVLHDQVLGRWPEQGPQVAPDDLGHPGVALDPRGERVVLPGRPHAVGVEQLLQCQVGDVDLAGGREDVADVGEERTVRPDDRGPAAAQIFGTQRVLADRNAADMRAGRSADDVHPEAVARAETAFDLLEHGLAARFGQSVRR
jgi:hypothetical protein